MSQDSNSGPAGPRSETGEPSGEIPAAIIKKYERLCLYLGIAVGGDEALNFFTELRAKESVIDELLATYENWFVVNMPQPECVVDKTGAPAGPGQKQSIPDAVRERKEDVIARVKRTKGLKGMAEPVISTWTDGAYAKAPGLSDEQLIEEFLKELAARTGENDKEWLQKKTEEVFKATLRALEES